MPSQYVWERAGSVLAGSEARWTLIGIRFINKTHMSVKGLDAQETPASFRVMIHWWPRVPSGTEMPLITAALCIRANLPSFALATRVGGVSSREESSRSFSSCACTLGVKCCYHVEKSTRTLGKCKVLLKTTTRDDLHISILTITFSVFFFRFYPRRSANARRILELSG